MPACLSPPEEADGRGAPHACEVAVEHLTAALHASPRCRRTLQPLTGGGISAFPSPPVGERGRKTYPCQPSSLGWCRLAGGPWPRHARQTTKPTGDGARTETAETHEHHPRAAAGWLWTQGGLIRVRGYGAVSRAERMKTACTARGLRRPTQDPTGYRSRTASSHLAAAVTLPRFGRSSWFGCRQALSLTEPTWQR